MICFIIMYWIKLSWIISYLFSVLIIFKELNGQKQVRSCGRDCWYLFIGSVWVETSFSCFHVHIPAMPTTSLHILDIQWYYTHMIRRIYIKIRTYITYSKYIVWYITYFSDSDWSSPGRIMGPQSMNDSWEAFASLVGQLFAREAPHALVRAPQGDDVENLGKLRILKQGKKTTRWKDMETLRD